MYGKRPLADISRAIRAIITNQVARAAPTLYMRLVEESGRGSDDESAMDVAIYFRQCFSEYFQQAGIRHDDVPAWLEGKRLLEYGPGDVPGVALMMLAHGAEKVTCVDRHALLRSTPKHIAILEHILDGLDPAARSRAAACFNSPGDPASGINPVRLSYKVTRNGLSGLKHAIDLCYSRAVLEHVNDLDATFDDMSQALKPGGLALHRVDLKSHGLHRENPLDFLSWPEWLWQQMYSGKGAPNRWRIDRYRNAIRQTGLEVRSLAPTEFASSADIAKIRPYLAEAFRALDDEDLSWMGFWLIATRPDQ